MGSKESAPSMKVSDVGISVRYSCYYHKETIDVILLDKDFNGAWKRFG